MTAPEWGVLFGVIFVMALLVFASLRRRRNR